MRSRHGEPDGGIGRFRRDVPSSLGRFSGAAAVHEGIDALDDGRRPGLRGRPDLRCVMAPPLPERPAFGREGNAAVGRSERPAPRHHVRITRSGPRAGRCEHDPPLPRGVACPWNPGQGGIGEDGSALRFGGLRPESAVTPPLAAAGRDGPAGRQPSMVRQARCGLRSSPRKAGSVRMITSAPRPARRMSMSSQGAGAGPNRPVSRAVMRMAAARGSLIRTAPGWARSSVAKAQAASRAGSTAARRTKGSAVAGAAPSRRRAAASGGVRRSRERVGVRSGAGRAGLTAPGPARAGGTSAPCRSRSWAIRRTRCGGAACSRRAAPGTRR